MLNPSRPAKRTRKSLASIRTNKKHKEEMTKKEYSLNGREGCFSIKVVEFRRIKKVVSKSPQRTVSLYKNTSLTARRRKIEKIMAKRQTKAAVWHR
jgi:hypothetical protein